MILEATTDDGAVLRIDCPRSLTSRWTNEAILRGATYPFVPFVGEVRTIVDAGANVGAATVYFAHRAPGARVHSIEPGAEARSYLERNVAHLPNVTVHPIALAGEDGTATLHVDRDVDLGQASIRHRHDGGHAEEVTVRAAGAWAAEQGITAIDVLKVDVEGCELEVLESLGRLTATAKVLYVEYDDRRTRRAIDALLAPTHELYVGFLFLDQGEATYVRSDLLTDDDAAREHLRSVLAGRQGG